MGEMIREKYEVLSFSHSPMITFEENQNRENEIFEYSKNLSQGK